MRLNSRFLKSKNWIPIYVILNAGINLIFNKVIFYFLGASGFSSFSLFKNYINFALNISTFNAQNSTIYYFSKIKKKEQPSLLIKYFFVSTVIALIISIIYFFLNPVNEYSRWFYFIIPFLSFLQVNRYFMIYEEKYFQLSVLSIFSSFILLFFIIFDVFDIKVIAVLSLFVSVISYLYYLRRNFLKSLQNNWNKLKNFLIISLKTWLPNLVSAWSLLGIRELYNSQTMSTEIAGIYDISQGLNIMIFGLVLSTLNLLILPRFVQKKLTLLRAYISYVPISVLFYSILIFFAPLLLKIAFGQLNSEYIFFFRILMVIDILRFTNLIEGLYLFSKDIILFPSLVDSLSWVFIYFAVILFIEMNLYIFPVSVLLSALIIKFLYWSRIVKVWA